MEWISPVWNLYFDFGGLNLLIITTGLAVYWLIKLDSDRERLKKRDILFSPVNFMVDHWVAILISILLTYVGMPLYVAKYQPDQLTILVVAMGGGVVFRYLHEVTLSRVRRGINKFRNTE